MACKRISQAARREQDYWLSFSDVKVATEEERLEFLRYDSHGGTPPTDNPILLGKIRHGQTGEVLRDARWDTDGGWIGGLALVEDYSQRTFGMRSLREWFGDEVVSKWCRPIFWGFNA